MSLNAAEWRANHDKEFVEGGSEFREKSEVIINQLRTNISDFFRVKENSTFLVPNFSFGFHALLNGLDKKHRFLLLKEDYPSIVNTGAMIGFEYRNVEIDENLEQNILAAIKSFKPSVFAFSMVQ